MSVTLDFDAFEARFMRLFTSLQADPPALQSFISKPQAVLEAEGIPIVESLTGPLVNSEGSGIFGDTTTLATDGPQLRVNKHWWGVDFIMNEELTQGIATGAIVGPPLAALVAGGLALGSVITGPVAAVVGAGFATAMAAKIVQIKLTDKGKGVHWPITWIQWAGVIAAVPGGPGGIVAALIVFIHPLRN